MHFDVVHFHFGDENNLQCFLNFLRLLRGDSQAIIEAGVVRCQPCRDCGSCLADEHTLFLFVHEREQVPSLSRICSMHNPSIFMRAFRFLLEIEEFALFCEVLSLLKC